jgi:uncharacterized nucleotidyltransferase DUF6036
LYAQTVRRKVTSDSLKLFMQELAQASRSAGKVYLTGGATALLLGFREQTIDIDLKLDPEPQGAFEAIAKLKNQLNVNVELASPDDFIPRPPNWRERARPITTVNEVEFFHYDFALQALAKIERGHTQDLEDVRLLVRHRHVTPDELRRVFETIEPELVRYPAIDPLQFKTKLATFLRGQG